MKSTKRWIINSVPFARELRVWSKRSARASRDTFQSIRYWLGLYYYHELKIPLKGAEHLIHEAGIHPWFLDYAVRNRYGVRQCVSAMAWIAANVSRETRIFETGCGCGANLIWLGQHGFDLLAGADISKEATAAGRGLAKLAGLSVAFSQEDCLAPRNPIPRAGLILALNWTYLCPEFELARFLMLYREALDPGGFIVIDMVDSAYDRMPDNQYLTDDWALAPELRRPSQYKIRMTREEVKQIGGMSGFQLLTVLAGSEIPPRFVAVLQRC